MNEPSALRAYELAAALSHRPRLRGLVDEVAVGTGEIDREFRVHRLTSRAGYVSAPATVQFRLLN